MWILDLFPDRALDVTSACHSLYLGETFDSVLADGRIRILRDHRLDLITKESLSIEMRDRSIEIVHSRILLNLLEINFIIAHRRLRGRHYTFYKRTRMLRLRRLLRPALLNAKIVLARGQRVPQIPMRLRMLVILQDLVRDVAAHFGVHGHVGEGFLQFLIHGRIIVIPQ